jgi:hypothetical protein
MFVINFDFSQEILPTKLFLINIPVIITEMLSYPLQRLQTLLISKTYITNNQIKEGNLILREMVGVEGFPKMYHGLRYSLDFSATQMSTKFVLFDLLMSYTVDQIAETSKWLLMGNCFLANTLSTVLAQSAFNYQTIASSLPINKANRDEDVRIKLRAYTTKNTVPLIGLKYTIPTTLLNTTVEIMMINYLGKALKDNGFSYRVENLFTAFVVLFATAFPMHFALQRQVELCNHLPVRSIPYSKGLVGTVVRHTVKGWLLFAIYLGYF